MTEPVHSTLAVELFVRDRRALVVGASSECESKVARLLDAGARVLVVTAGAEVSEAIRELAKRGELELAERAFRPLDVEGMCVVFVAAELESIGVELAGEALASGRLVSTLDRPEASTFINPAVVRKNGISMTVSSGGAAPALVKRLRIELERLLSDVELGRFVDELRAQRAAKKRGERSAEGKRLADGFTVEWRLSFPAWFRR